MIQERFILGRLAAARWWIRAVGHALPHGAYVVDLRGHDGAAVMAHLRRCCGPALCCSEDVADMMEAQARHATNG